MKDAAKKRIEKASRERLCVACLRPFKPGEVADRGCHHACAKATRRAIKQGKFTEQGRIEEGKLLPPKVAGRPPSNPISIEAAAIDSVQGAVNQ